MASEVDGQVLTTERALIGAVLYERGQVIPPLLAHEFFSDRHRQVWEVLTDLAEGIDAGILMHELARLEILDAVGGPSFIAQCLEDGVLVIPALIPRYAALIREACRLRMTGALGERMRAQGMPPEQVERELAQLPGPLTRAEPYVPSDTWHRWQQRLRHHGPGLSTGLHALDEILGSVLPGELGIVAGRTSHGKTAFMLHLVLHAAAQDMPVTVISLEETAALVTARLVSARSEIPYVWLAQGVALTAEQQRAVDAALRWLDGLPITLLDLETLKTSDVDTVCGAVAAATTPLVAVDHLQKITTRHDSRVYGIEDALNRLHAAALRQNRIILVSAQLNRDSEVDRRPPRLSDLRDSGSVEILARKLMLLYWPWRHDKTKDPYDYQIDLAKNATGRTAIAAVRFRAATGAFWDVPSAPPVGTVAE